MNKVKATVEMIEAKVYIVYFNSDRDVTSCFRVLTSDTKVLTCNWLAVWEKYGRRY